MHDKLSCPCFQSDAPMYVQCTGLAGIATSSLFANKKCTLQHEYDFCDGGLWWNCPVYRAATGDKDGSRGFAIANKSIQSSATR